ncbi:FAD-binding and (Fe-S)-binding domain-containing protein, partial [Bacteroidota bacterium]
IRTQYPEKSIKRRNTGYALDLLLDTAPFGSEDQLFNFSKLIAGSEGTLAFITEIKLNLVPLPPKVKGLICVHLETLHEALKANLIALKHNPGAIELMDHVIIDCTKDNLSQRENRFFIEGDPGAILIIEFARDSKEEIIEISNSLERDLREHGYGYHFPKVFGDDINKIWALRKAGLGLLSNIPGDAKPVAVIEDTAVNPEVLPQYIEEFQKMLDNFGLSCVYYAHIATGELHLRPVLNLKTKKDTRLFHTVAYETAKLVKKYKGSLSGEHGDGRLRGEFIPLMLGDKNYELLRSIKNTWDPDHIFNPGKIVDTPSMNTSLRFIPGRLQREIPTTFDFTESRGILRAAELCNGSGDCRKSEKIGGVMCPSYMALKDENKTTRARANILREFLTNSSNDNPFDHKEIYDVMDLCLSCKGCKSECPSSVDITKYKAEFLQHYYEANAVPLRTRLIANITALNKLGMIWPTIFNFIISNKLISGIFKRFLGFAPKRSIPKIYRITLKTWLSKNNHQKDKVGKNGKVLLFADEFTNYNDVEVGIKTIKLLNALDYAVEIPKHKVSGRTYLSKGLVNKAQKLANINVTLLKDKVNKNHPLIGIEPSGILTFRDEYKDLVKKELKESALQISKNAYLIDEIEKGRIQNDVFTNEEKNIRLHGHCYQKALSSTKPTLKILSFPENYKVEEIMSGCCGMAGAFGYEKEHYDVSMKVGELILFPEIMKTKEDVIIAAPGTSCRHQIRDGTGRKAMHPVEVLYEALIKKD